MRRLAIVALLCGCGRLGFQRLAEDAGPDASVVRDAGRDAAVRDAGPRDGGSRDAGRDGGRDAGCTWSPFGAPEIIAAVSTPDLEGGGTLSADRLHLYFNRAQMPGMHDLYVASRATLSAAFDSGTAIAELNGSMTNEAEAAPSDDELTIYFHSNRGAISTTYVADRATRTAPFANVRCAIVGCAQLLGPTAAQDGLSLFGFFASGADQRLGESTRRATAALFDAPAEVTALTVAGSDVGYPGLSHDGLELYYVLDGPGTLGCSDLWVATRSSTSAPFGGAHAVAELNSATCEGDPSLSADGRTLIFTADRDGGDDDIWKAERTCSF